MIQAVNRHQALLRASIASAGQDHRLGANEAPPAIISIFLGAELLRAFEAIESGHSGVEEEKGFLGLGTEVLPPLPMHGGDRNRTSPFAFTGNKFEFRALGSSQSLSLPNTVLNTIVAEALDDLGGELEAALEGGASLDEAVPEIVKASFAANKQIIFEGDNYSEDWHEEAAGARAVQPAHARPTRCPWLVEDQTVDGVLRLRRALASASCESRYDVYVEQYVIKVNIEAEVAATIARTMLLPAAVRHLRELQAAGRRAGGRRRRTSLVARAVVGDHRARGGQRDPRGRGGLARARRLHARHRAPGDGGRPRGGRQARADRGRRPLAAAEVLGDAVHQVGGRTSASGA